MEKVEWLQFLQFMSVLNTQCDRGIKLTPNSNGMRSASEMVEVSCRAQELIPNRAWNQGSLEVPIRCRGMVSRGPTTRECLKFRYAASGGYNHGGW